MNSHALRDSSFFYIHVQVRIHKLSRKSTRLIDARIKFFQVTFFPFVLFLSPTTASWPHPPGLFQASLYLTPHVHAHTHLSPIVRAFHGKTTTRTHTYIYIVEKRSATTLRACARLTRRTLYRHTSTALSKERRRRDDATHRNCKNDDKWWWWGHTLTHTHACARSPGGLYNPGASEGASTDRLVARLPGLGPFFAHRAHTLSASRSLLPRARVVFPSLSLSVPRARVPYSSPRAAAAGCSSVCVCASAREREEKRAAAEKRRERRGRSGAAPRIRCPAVCHGAKSGNHVLTGSPGE